MPLSREDILTSRDLETAKLEIPEWNGNLYVREMTGVERAYTSDKFASVSIDDISQLDGESGSENVVTQAKDFTMADMLDLYSYIACRCVVDENGERVFKDDDQEILKEKDMDVLQRITEKVNELSGFTDEAVEVAEKN